MTGPVLSLDGRVAVVLGGTAGIGRALSLGLAQAGADVVATGRRPEQVEETASEVGKLGRRTLRLTADDTDRPSLERLLGATVSSLGKVDILVNCAGRTKRAPTLDFSEGDWRDILETNLMGTLQVARCSAGTCSSEATAASSTSPR